MEKSRRGRKLLAPSFILSFIGASFILWVGPIMSPLAAEPTSGESPRPAVTAGPDMIAYVESDVPFRGAAATPDMTPLTCRWDFDGDGVIDWTSATTGRTVHRFGKPGNYTAHFSVADEKGRQLAASALRVVVRSGRGAAMPVPKMEYRRSQTPEERRAERDGLRLSLNLTLDEARFLGFEAPVPIKYLIPPLNINAAPAGDGVPRRHVIMFNGANEDRFWEDVTTAYAMFHDVYGIPEDDIHLLNYDGTNPAGLNPAGMIDGEASADSLEGVVNALAPIVDNDDLVFVWITGHGYGYIGPIQRASSQAPLWGYLDGWASVDPGDEEDYRESDFKLRGFFNPGVYRGRMGLEEWKVVEFPASQTYYRHRYVSHFTNRYFNELGRTASDNDIYIEEVIDYLEGDLNRDGRITGAEAADFDNDGTPPFSFTTGTFDEDDWGLADRYEDDLVSISTQVPAAFQSTYRPLDIGLDDRLDIDLDFDPAAPEANGTDMDNDGLFDGLDVNDDKDQTDWVSIDEVIQEYITSLPPFTDDRLAAMLDTLHPAVTVTVLMNCSSGGFAWDLRGPGRITLSATEEETASFDNSFIRNITAALQQAAVPGSNGDPTTADADGNGRVSMAEMFNFASANDMWNGIEIPQYDDNGDGATNPDPLPAGGDGALGAITYLDGWTPPAVMDLAMLQMIGPAMAAPGASVVLNDCVINYGTGAATGFSIGYYISADATITSGDTFVAGRTLSGLGAGYSNSDGIAVAVPGFLPPGVYYWGAIVDSLDEQAEADEGNNAYCAGSFTVANPAVLRLQYVSYRREASSDTVSVNFCVYNDGATDVSLEDVSAAYWYKSEWPDDEMVEIDDARSLPVGRDIRSATSARLIRPTGAAAGQNRLLSVNFKPGTGILKPNERLEIKIRVHYKNWKKYTQPDDYSFGTHVAFQNWTKMAVYHRGALVWGAPVN
jgi:PKD repeat protein